MAYIIIIIEVGSHEVTEVRKKIIDLLFFFFLRKSFRTASAI